MTNLLTWIAIWAACSPLEHFKCSRQSVELCRHQLKQCVYVDKNDPHECFMSFNLGLLDNACPAKKGKTCK
jgi:hypothetical protein